MSDVEILAIPNGQFIQNCYLLVASGGDAVLVDPGEDWETFLARLREREARLSAIWLTHAHIDHILGVAGVHQATGAPVWLHPADLPLYRNLPQQGLWFGFRSGPPPEPQHELTHGQRLPLGDASFEVRHTPGHSPGHVCFVGAGVVLAGDALFAGSIGRTDLPGGDYDTLIRSIRTQLLTLPDDTRVLSGHGPETRIGIERHSNPFLT